MTKVELELIPDPGMFIFFEKYMRGVISYISNNYSKVNDKYLKPYMIMQFGGFFQQVDSNG